jgi:serine/threonine protein phosphatase PrpC
MIDSLSRLTCSKSFSGACAIVTVALGSLIFVANAGDCRAIMARKMQTHSDISEWNTTVLSTDHTALTEEAAIRAQVDTSDHEI